MVPKDSSHRFDLIKVRAVNQTSVALDGKSIQTIMFPISLWQDVVVTQ